MLTMKTLLAQPARPGSVLAIGLRPERRADVISVAAARIEIGLGLIGDRFRGTAESKRQVTLIQAEHIAAVASFLGLAALDGLSLRRNVIVTGINLLALKGRPFRVGTALLEYTGLCEPCSRMEELLGPGGYNAMRGHGGITARVLAAGEVQVGAPVYIDGPVATGASVEDHAAAVDRATAGNQLELLPR